MALHEEIPDWARACPSGKMKFTSSKQTRNYIRGLKAGSVKGNAKPYHCVLCGAYHFTHDSRQHNKRKNGKGSE